MKFKNSLRIYPVVLSLTLGFAGCVSVYNPNPLNVPLLKEKGDMKVTASLSYGFQGQLAAAVTNGIGIIASAGSDSGSKTEIESSHERTTSHYNVEAGIGYFTKLSETWIFEVYGGGGFGGFKDNKNYSNIFDASSNSEIKGTIYKGFIQPAIGYNSNTFSISLALRNVYISLKDISGGQSNLHIGKGSWFIEPALTMKLGGKALKFLMQFGTSRPSSFANTYNWEPDFVFGGLGIELNIVEIFKSK